MFRTLVVMATGLAASAVYARAQDDDKKATIEPVSVMVSRKLKDKYLYSSSMTSVSFKLTKPGKQILRVDTSSKVSEFKDDKGNSLLGDGFFKPNFYGGTPTQDRSGLIVSLA